MGTAVLALLLLFALLVVSAIIGFGITAGACYAIATVRTWTARRTPREFHH
jgi:hypothetical protein